MMKALLYIFLFMIMAAGCTNPFAPAENKDAPGSQLLGDQSTVEGLFQNFRYAYLFKDTLIYGRLLADDFNFIYTDYEEGIDKSWGRQEDVLATSRMFGATQNIDLVWNNFAIAEVDTNIREISRQFILTVRFNPNDVVQVNGRVNMILRRQYPDADWKIERWRDESNF
ncbi:MAG: hypothetical protein ACLFR2_12865 [Candidatus Kapaibacterium sp.]